jgi:cyanophycin synthetase
MISHILGQAGLRVGMATTDGVYCGGQLIYEADASGPRSAEMVLDDSTVEAAVLETARGGTVVLNADDPRSAGLAQRPLVRERNPVVRFFSLSGNSPVVMAHRMSGGIACLLRDGQPIEARGGEETVLLHTDELPGSFGGAAAHLIANALAAAAACRALGVSVKDIRRGFATFTPAEANPGRGNVYQVGGSRWWWTTGTTPPRWPAWDACSARPGTASPSRRSPSPAIAGTT